MKNYNKFFLDSNVELIHLEAFNTSQKINLNIVKTKSAFSFFLENLREVRSILKLKLPPDLRKKIVNHSLPQLAIYTYLCAFLSAIKEQIPQVKIFHSGADLLSIVATRIGIESVYLSHGLDEKMSKFSYPFQDHIYVYSSEEKSYIENIVRNATVSLYPIKELSKLEKRVIIFLSAYDRQMSEEGLSELLTLFLKKDYKIFLKKHPTYIGSWVDKFVKKYNLELIDPEKDASEIILYLKPSFTVGWRSTALCESLRHGVVPIALPRGSSGSASTNPYFDKFFTEQDFVFWTIYPLWKRSLSWMEEKERIVELLEDTSLYEKTLSKLRVR